MIQVLTAFYARLYGSRSAQKKAKKKPWRPSSVQVTDRYELDPKVRQRILLAKHAGTARFAYNWGLARRIGMYQQTGKTTNAIEQYRELNSLKKKKYPWPYEVTCRRWPAEARTASSAGSDACAAVSGVGRNPLDRRSVLPVRMGSRSCETALRNAKQTVRPERTVVQSVERALRVFEFLVEHREAPLGEVARAAALHKTTAMRLLHTLASRGYVEQDPRTGRYRLGTRAIEVGSRAVHGLPLRQAARGPMEELAQRVGETVNLAVPDPDQGEVIYVETVEGHRMLRIDLAVGRRAPIHCTAVGKAVLAHRPDLLGRLRGRPLPSFTPNTITDEAALLADLESTRRRGYALDDEEQEAGARCLAAPVFDGSGRAIAGLGISGPSVRLTRRQLDRLAPLVVAAAQEVSARLGQLT